MPKHIYIVNFEKYHKPALRFLHSGDRTGPLEWVRLQTNWADDMAIVTMPEEERWLWPALCALAGQSTPPGHVVGTAAELAMRWRTTEERVTSALQHLWQRRRIRYSTKVAA